MAKVFFKGGERATKFLKGQFLNRFRIHSRGTDTQNAAIIIRFTANLRSFKDT